MSRSLTKPIRLEILFIVVVTLLAFALRLVALVEVPPGWRDDELINIYALSGELSEGHFPLYFSGASGHEPMYHYLQAGINAWLGYNILSGHLLSAVLGTLAVPLTFILARRLFGALTAALTALALSVSFWSLMYSRIGLRHINLPPFALAVFVLLWPALIARRRPGLRWAILLGLTLGASLYIYPAARMLPVVLIVFGLYLAFFHRELFRAVWARYALALAVAAVVAAPLAVAIIRGSSEAAAQGIGADARLVELARPIRALREGDPGPLLENVWTTLGMFHATGDPEWLYNIPERPVFNALGGVLLWAGVFLCLYRWRQPRYFFLLLWLALGLLPTVLSVPPASLSHSMLIQPLAYLLPALVLAQFYGWARSQWSKRKSPGRLAGVTRYVVPMLIVLVYGTNFYRDLHDYFVVWPRLDMVRFLYRADYRQAAQYLDDHPEIVDVAVGSTLLGPWDRLALMDDLDRDDVRVRLFNPQRSLLLPAESAPEGHSGEGAAILVTAFPPLDQAMAGLLGESPIWQKGSLQRYAPLQAFPISTAAPPSPVRFDNGLELVGVSWPEGEPEPGREAILWLIWYVAGPVDLPPIPIVANPPPPGVYNGPRLAVFTHLLDADGSFVVGDDALWVDPVTLWPGDRFLQIHRLALPAGTAAEGLTLELGLYDPLTSERWFILDAEGKMVADRLLLPIRESEP